MEKATRLIEKLKYVNKMCKLGLHLPKKGTFLPLFLFLYSSPSSSSLVFHFPLYSCAHSLCLF